jgi:hypothetical protein
MLWLELSCPPFEEIGMRRALGPLTGRDTLQVSKSATFLKDDTQKCASDASAVSASDPTSRVLLDG